MTTLFLKLIALTFPLFILLDGIWLGLVAKNFYAQKIGYIMTESVNWWSAFLFYVIFVISIIFFVIIPALEKNSWMHAVFAGVLFGLVTYATYDLTNLATLRGWPLSVTIIDLIWGSVLSGTIAVSVYFLAQKLGIWTR